MFLRVDVDVKLVNIGVMVFKMPVVNAKDECNSIRWFFISCVVSEIHKVGIKRVPYEKCFLQREREYV